MKSLKQISKEQTLALQAERQKALDDVKRPLADYVNFARQELPNIDAALAEADVFRRQNIDVIDWKAIGGMSPAITFALGQIESQRGNPGALREDLRRYDALKWQDAWGHRADGTRDINRAATLRGSFNFLLASSSVVSIEKAISQLKAEIARVEERLAWNNGETLSPEVRLIAVPANDGPDKLTVLNNLPHD